MYVNMVENDHPLTGYRWDASAWGMHKPRGSLGRRETRGKEDNSSWVQRNTDHVSTARPKRLAAGRESTGATQGHQGR